MNIQMYYRFIPSLKTFPKMFDFMPPKNIFEELRAIFVKIQCRGLQMKT